MFIDFLFLIERKSFTDLTTYNLQCWKEQLNNIRIYIIVKSYSVIICSWTNRYPLCFVFHFSQLLCSLFYCHFISANNTCNNLIGTVQPYKNGFLPYPYPVRQIRVPKLRKEQGHKHQHGIKEHKFDSKFTTVAISQFAPFEKLAPMCI